MINRLMASYYQYYTSFMTWYHAADLPTQYLFLIVSGLIVFFFSTIVVLSRITK
jgi:hypothetical protein